MIIRPVFVDASAWVALSDVRDRLHSDAALYWRIARDERRYFVSSDYVLDEAFTLLRRRRSGLAMAVALERLTAESRILEIEPISDEVRQEAWEIFVGYEDQVLSFTDCTSFALMRRLRLLEAFTFDGDFQRAGFVVRPERPGG